MEKLSCSNPDMNEAMLEVALEFPNSESMVVICLVSFDEVVDVGNLLLDVVNL